MKIIKLKFCIFIYLSLSFLSTLQAHPLKMSVTRIHFNEKTEKAKISIKLFIDDFGVCLESECPQKIDFSKLKSDLKARTCLLKYVKNNFSLALNDKKLLLTLTNFSLKGGDTDNESIVLEF